MRRDYRVEKPSAVHTMKSTAATAVYYASLEH